MKTAGEKHQVRQRKERGRYDLASARDVLEGAQVAHVGIVDDDGQPIVIPMLCALDEDRLLLHGGVASRLMRCLARGVPVCVSVTRLDGLVLAASTFEHSANYRSLVVFGKAELIDDPEEKACALETLVEKLIPGRSSDTRAANRKELNATTLVAVPLETFSVKQRKGGAGEPGVHDPQDTWTGVLPVETRFGQPVPDNPAVELPDYLQTLL